MTIHSIVIQKLLSTKAHLGRRVAAHHFKVYICGSRNGIAILDSDKTLICLRNACHFIGSPIRQKGRSFFVNTNSLFDEIIEQMATRIGCINDSQWRIGGFLTNCSSPKKIRSRNKKINFGSNQQPDCVVIFDADRKSSVILEADRLQIPIASLVDSNIPLGSYKRITYPIPANDPIQFVYLFRNSITKTVLLERGRIVAMKETAGEERTHRPELLQVLLDKGGLTNKRKMELVPQTGRKPHFLVTDPFKRPFIRGFHSTGNTLSPFPFSELNELIAAVGPFLSPNSSGISDTGMTDGNVGAYSLSGAKVIPSSGTTSTEIPPPPSTLSVDLLQAEQDLWGAPQLPGSPSPSNDSQKLLEAFIAQGTEVLPIERTTATESPPFGGPPAHEAPPLAPAPAEVPHAPHPNLDPNPPEQEIGGESLSQINNRLLLSNEARTPASLDKLFAKGASIFEGKRQILHKMEELDPGGGWLTGGAKFIKNMAWNDFSPRTLGEVLRDLERSGTESPYFQAFLKKREIGGALDFFWGLIHQGYKLGL